MPRASLSKLRSNLQFIFQPVTHSALAAVSAYALVPVVAQAQDGAPPGIDTVQPRPDLPPMPDTPPELPRFEPADNLPAPTAAPREIDFEANTLSYDSNSEVVTASGNVLLSNENQTLRSDQVTWNRETGLIVAGGDVLLQRGDQSVRSDTVNWNSTTGEITAQGNVRFVDEDGNQLYTERLTLTDAFDAGAMDDLLIALREGGRLAARSGAREADGSLLLTDAAYSACDIRGPDGCEKEPSWRITADRVTYDPATDVIRFKGAYLELFGLRLLPLPGLSVKTNGQATSGIGVPDLRFSKSNGVEVSGSYYLRVGDNRDLTLGASVYTQAPPMVSAQWRHLTDLGAYQVTGYLTNSRRIGSFTGVPNSETDWRGYVFANGKFQFTPEWSFTGAVRLASDRTFLRRYDLSREDRLRSTFNLERIDDSSYLSLAGWATQTLRLGVPQGQVPFALPVFDYRKRLADPLLGGTVELQANTLLIARNEGQDTQRAFAGARWDLRKLTPLGQVVTFSALARGDVYHSDENGLTETAIYRGNPGWETRAIALSAVDVEWPLIGEAFGGQQIFTPRVQLVASPSIKNLAVPNEDSRAIDLEDTNLFSLNRFSGYDRVEDGVRVTYGFDWQFTRPGWRLKSTFGQSYRLDKDPEILLDGTGLSERLSDFVGRTEVRYRDFVKFTHRFRLDKDNLAVRRNEIDATVGSDRTYAEIGYLRLNRNIPASFEDLQDREELRAAARVAFAKYWSVFGSGVVNLTNFEEDPSFTSDGFEPIRTRLGVAYQDDCLEMGLTWRRDYVTAGDAQRGDTFQLYFSLRNLGFR